MGKYVHTSPYFYGNAISDYGLENGYVDYRTLARAFDSVLNNEIIEKTTASGYYWEIYSGSDYDEEEGNYHEIYQYFIISDFGANVLSTLTNEIVFYNEELDMYVWGVTHCGTGWDYVLTDIKIKLDDKDDK